MRQARLIQRALTGADWNVQSLLTVPVQIAEVEVVTVVGIALPPVKGRFTRCGPKTLLSARW
jgi:hypothetical protein